ncbi:hypothetical protein DMC25_04115 [Caulobacter sp. D4A]|nr:hypothetical protein DMC25_04115 [Caulobacter sp. D4A]
MIAIGCYALDRWGAEATVPTGGKGYLRDLRRAVDNCSGRHFQSIITDAEKRLNDYRSRNSVVATMAELDSRAKMLVKDIAKSVDELSERPKLVQTKWLDITLVEMGKGVLAALGVIVAATALSLLSPRYRSEAYNFATSFFSQPASHPTEPTSN